MQRGGASWRLEGRPGQRSAGPHGVLNRSEKRTGLRLGIALFRDDEGGFTTVAVAAALLVSLALVFSVAGAQWTAARAADVQAIADTSALAGEDMVAAYATVAQVIDASVLSLGLLGVIASGIGLVLCAIPPVAEAGLQVVSWGGEVLAHRRSFAKTSAEGLARLEKLLPGLVLANSAAVVGANEGELVCYAGCAVPFPTESKSDFSALIDDLSGDEMGGLSGEIQEAARTAEEAKGRAEALKQKGWLADCGSEGRCLRERAEALAGLSAAANPNYPLESWTFGAPLARARSYYAARKAQERTGDYSDPHEIRDSACRAAFYAYALGEVNAGSYTEDEDGRVTSCSLSSLPRNTEQMRTTSLYTDARWPTGGGVLHASQLCPAYSSPEGFASIKQLEAGTFKTCDSCGMTAFFLGQVASATTNTDVGFEHWWREIVGASVDYQRARNEQLDAEKRLDEAEKKADEAFGKAIEKLGVRPKLCPPGAWGCVGIVLREGETTAQLGPSVFAASQQLPSGAAIAGAVLAPDPHTENNDVLSSFFDALTGGEQGPSVGGVLDGVVGLWSRLLKGYGGAAKRMSDAAESAFSLVDLLPAGEFARKLLNTFSSAVNAAGFAAPDLRLRKPVLTNTAQILDKSDVDVDNIRSTVQSLPSGAGPVDVARAFALHYMDTGDLPETFTVAELGIPGTAFSAPLTINLRELVGGAS